MHLNMSSSVKLKVWTDKPKSTNVAKTKAMHCLKRDTNFNFPISVLFNIVIITLCQVLGRTSPFPLILLPQFGGYWIEGTNHEPKDTPEADQPPGSASHIKLETNSTAKIYRKQFMGKVRMGRKGQRKNCVSWFDILNHRIGFVKCLLVPPPPPPVITFQW